MVNNIYTDKSGIEMQVFFTGADNDLILRLTDRVHEDAIVYSLDETDLEWLIEELKERLQDLRDQA